MEPKLIKAFITRLFLAPVFLACGELIDFHHPFVPKWESKRIEYAPLVEEISQARNKDI
jgi:hypothetical protein